MCKGSVGLVALELRIAASSSWGLLLCYSDPPTLALNLDALQALCERQVRIGPSSLELVKNIGASQEQAGDSVSTLGAGLGAQGKGEYTCARALCLLTHSLTHAQVSSRGEGHGAHGKEEETRQDVPEGARMVFFSSLDRAELQGLVPVSLAWVFLGLADPALRTNIAVARERRASPVCSSQPRASHWELRSLSPQTLQ